MRQLRQPRIVACTYRSPSQRRGDSDSASGDSEALPEGLSDTQGLVSWALGEALKRLSVPRLKEKLCKAESLPDLILLVFECPPDPANRRAGTGGRIAWAPEEVKSLQRLHGLQEVSCDRAASGPFRLLPLGC